MVVLTTTLAVLWAWEYLLDLSPVALPAWLHPAAVAALAYGADYLPDHVRVAMAAAGGVALLHRQLRSAAGPHMLVRRSTRRLPPL